MRNWTEPSWNFSSAPCGRCLTRSLKLPRPAVRVTPELWFFRGCQHFSTLLRSTRHFRLAPFPVPAPRGRSTGRRHSMTLRKIAPPLALLSLAAAPLIGGSRSEAVFKKLQFLAGEWEGKDDHGMAVKTNFRVMASKTAVMETLSASGMEAIVTLYNIDGDGIALVHYCPTNNQPRMRVAQPSDDVNELSLNSQGAGNPKSP